VLRLDNHFLTNAGKQSAKRILCIIALDRPDLDYCPILPDLVAIALQFLNEEDTFILMHLMLNKSLKDKWFFQTNLKDNKLFIINFEEIIRERYCKKTIAGKAKRSSHKKIYDRKCICYYSNLTRDQISIVWELMEECCLSSGSIGYLQDLFHIR
jgi:hypothetical protein